MEKVSLLGKKRNEKVLQLAEGFLFDIMAGVKSDEELDRQRKIIHQNIQQIEKRESEESYMVAEKLHTPEQVAEHLQISRKKVLSLLRDKKIKGIKIEKEWRITEEDLQAYIDELKTKRNGKA